MASEEGEDCQTGDLVRGHVVRRSHGVTSQRDTTTAALISAPPTRQSQSGCTPRSPPAVTLSPRILREPSSLLTDHMSSFLPSHPRLAPATLPN